MALRGLSIGQFTLPHPFHILHPLQLVTSGSYNNQLPPKIHHLISHKFDRHLHTSVRARSIITHLPNYGWFSISVTSKLPTHHKSIALMRLALLPMLEAISTLFWSVAVLEVWPVKSLRPAFWWKWTYVETGTLQNYKNKFYIVKLNILKWFVHQNFIIWPNNCKLYLK